MSNISGINSNNQSTKGDKQVNLQQEMNNHRRMRSYIHATADNLSQTIMICSLPPESTGGKIIQTTA